MTASNPLLIDAKQVAELLGIGRSLLYEMQSAGRLGPMPIRLGRAVRWRKEEIESWVAEGCPSRTRWLASRKGA